uniref:TSA: Wollemia nobilis Ref_Wollemi_Transcript_25555_1930 transcribed RNA sequence n=1 Tax=Wollemia nobilis TaxID=56998 RepID=A0A0C9S1E5_9CONI
MMHFKLLDIKLKRLTRRGESSSVYALVIKRVIGCFGKRVWQRIMLGFSTCCMKSGPSRSYQRLTRSLSASMVPEVRDLEACETGFRPGDGFMIPATDFSEPPSGELTLSDLEADDTVILKITMLGDSETGKTSFMAKYVNSEGNGEYVQTTGVSCMDKVFRIRGVKIAFNIWDFGGHLQFTDIVPRACQDAAAILIMFDLTSRSTLNNVMDWYQQARQINQTAIPVLIGTKFDQFIHLPRDMQLTIVKQARIYAHTMGAILFFSSVTHNINVHKIFKVITAKLFDLSFNIARNLNIGEPIIDF